jgi:hypothetical protein
MNCSLPGIIYTDYCMSLNNSTAWNLKCNSIDSAGKVHDNLSQVMYVVLQMWQLKVSKENKSQLKLAKPSKWLGNSLNNLRIPCIWCISISPQNNLRCDITDFDVEREKLQQTTINVVIPIYIKKSCARPDPWPHHRWDQVWWRSKHSLPTGRAYRELYL